MINETDYSQKYFCNFDGLFGGGSGGSSGGGSTDSNVTTTVTNPVVPDDMKALADALNAIATGTLGSPVNFGPTAIDAPSSGPLIPQASMGTMFANPAFQSGMQGMQNRPRRMPIRRPLPQRNQQPFTNSNNMGNVFSGRM